MDSLTERLAEREQAAADVVAHHDDVVGRAVAVLFDGEEERPLVVADGAHVRGVCADGDAACEAVGELIAILANRATSLKDGCLQQHLKAVGQHHDHGVVVRYRRGPVEQFHAQGQRLGAVSWNMIAWRRM